ncbi:mucin-2 isoform X2 [Anguilla rostrata]|uniref:mucin-2 isoform X2 n=1 Tax=Anguilla rostrata TaxID=7938 RepID=UPI0030CAE98A
MLLRGRSLPSSFFKGCSGTDRVPRVTVTSAPILEVTNEEASNSAPHLLMRRIHRCILPRKSFHISSFSDSNLLGHGAKRNNMSWLLPYRGMPGTDPDSWRRSKSEFICYVLLSLMLLLCLVVPAEASFMHDSKVHFSQDSGDHWTLRDSVQVPELVHMTVCVHVRVLVPGEWTAYTYGHPQAQERELGLQGDRQSLYVWLLGVRHSFPVHLLPRRWYHVCLKRDASRQRVSLDVDGSPSVRTVVAENVPGAGELVLGSKDRGDSPSKAGAGAVELYLFRIWDDIGRHGVCEDEGVVGWRSEQWEMGNHPPLQDESLLCAILTSATSGIHPTPPRTDIPPIPPSTRTNPPAPLTTSHKVLSAISHIIVDLSNTSDKYQPALSTQPPNTVITSAQPISFAPHSAIFNTSPPPTFSTQPPAAVLTSTQPTHSTQSPSKVITSTQHTSTTPHSNRFPASTQRRSSTESHSKASTQPTSSTKSQPSFTNSTQPTSSTESQTSFTNSTRPTSRTKSRPSLINSTQPTPSTKSRTSFTNSTQPTSSTESPTTFTNSTQPTPSTKSRPSFINSTQPTSSTESPTTFTNSTQPTSSTESPTTFKNSTQPTSSTESPTTFTNSTQPTSSTESPTTFTNSTEPTSSTESPTTFTNSTQPTSSTEFPTTFTNSTQPTSSTQTAFSESPATSNVSATSMEPMMNTSTTASFTVPTMATSSNNTAGPAMLHCSFSDLCANKSAFYWMVLEVQPINGKNNESISEAMETWLQSVFSVSACVPSNVGASSSNSVSSVREGTCKNENETSVSLFQGVEVMCDDKENQSSKTTVCTVLLQLSQRTDPCVLHQVLETNKGTSISARLLGNVERVGKGLCTSEEMLPVGGGFEKCNSSLPLPDDCHTEGPVTCKRYAETVVVPVESLSPVGQNCTTSNVSEEVGCDCSAFCNETAAYYTLTLGVTNHSILFENITSLIHELGSTPRMCNSSDCTEVPIISRVYQECFGMGTQIDNCTVVLKLAKSMDICTLRATIVSLIEKKQGVFYNGPLRRVAICGWPAGSSGIMSIANFTWIGTNLEYSRICQDNSISYKCKSGETLGMPLTEVCLPDPPMVTTSSQPNTTIQHNATSGPPQNTTTPSIKPNTTGPLLNTTVAPRNSTTHRFNTTAVPPANATTSSLNVTKHTTQITVPMTTASAEAQAAQLLELTRNVSSLNSSQVDQLVTKLEGLLSGPNVSLTLGNTSVTIVSNLLNAPVTTLASSSNRIIRLVDTVGLKLVVKGETETILSDSVALAVKKVDGANFQGTTFLITNPSNVQINRALRAQTPSSPQGSITLPPNLTIGLTPQQQLLASRIQFNFYQKSTVFQDRNLRGKLNSGILGTSVANLSITNLTNKVFITLRNNEPVPANFVASCVFWDFRMNGGSGGWNPSGCSVEKSTNEETNCSCNHLTSFAVLLDISREGITNRVQSIILTYITNIGCGISAIFLSITLLTYLAFEKLRKDIPSKILIQLCTALLLLNLTFLLDSWLALYPEAKGLCISTAFFLHYFLLVSFTWMCLEAIHMYLALVKVFNTYVSRYMLKFSLVGWGVPLVVVIIVIAINPEKNYGLVSYGKFANGTTDGFCWVKNDVAFYVSVVAYFCVVFLVNLTMFVVVLVQLYRIKRQNPHNTQQRSTLHNMRSVAGLTVILGLTWGFAFFAWGPVNLAFMYLFAIFNSLQGFFIFIFHCAIKDNVRRQWRTYLCCGKLRLLENTDWSRTATHHRTTNRFRDNKATSFGSSNSLHSSNTSSSSFLASDSNGGASGIGGVYEDREITALEEPNGDVVLNDIHSRHRTPRGQ